MCANYLGPEPAPTSIEWTSESSRECPLHSTLSPLVPISLRVEGESHGEDRSLRDDHYSREDLIVTHRNERRKIEGCPSMGPGVTPNSTTIHIDRHRDLIGVASGRLLYGSLSSQRDYLLLREIRGRDSVTTKRTIKIMGTISYSLNPVPIC